MTVREKSTRKRYIFLNSIYLDLFLITFGLFFILWVNYNNLTYRFQLTELTNFEFIFCLYNPKIIFATFFSAN